ncbi:MAG: phenylacetate--CoA ligase family protein [Promethearchaeota archaeon]
MVTIKNKLKLKLQEVLAGYEVYNYLNFLLESQFYIEKEIKELQTQNFLKLAHHTINNVPYFSQYFKENNISTSNFNTLDDLKKFPVMTKDLYRNNFPDSVVDIHAKKKDLVLNYTSGTSGNPFTFYYSIFNRGHQAARLLRYYEWTGRKNRELMVRFWASRDTTLKKKIFHKFFDKIFTINAFDLSESTFPFDYEKIIRKNPLIAEGYTSTVYEFAMLLKKHNLQLNIPSMILSGETLYDFQTDLIEERFNTQIYNRYGCREFGAIAQECSERTGLHISEEDLIVEILDDENNPVANGEKGNIVITSLDNYVMPLIRYKIGDIGALSDESCPCGRSLKMFKNVEGRVSDVIFTPTGKHLSLFYFTSITRKLMEYIYEFQVNQKKSNKDLILKIIPSSKYTKDIENQLISSIKSLDESLNIEIEIVDDIPREENGKKKLLKIIE